MRTLLVLCTLALATASAQEWNQWRGPTRDAAVPASSTPRAWPATLQRAWRVEIGEGYSSPVVAGSRLYTLGATGILTAWSVQDGSPIWRKDYSASVDTSKLFCGTAPSPVID